MRKKMSVAKLDILSKVEINKRREGHHCLQQIVNREKGRE
jgi:hypothetical protein